MERARSHPVVGPPDRDDDDHDDYDGDSGVEVHFPLAFLLAAETQTCDIIGHVRPRPPKLWTRNKYFVISTTTRPHRIVVALIATQVAAGLYMRYFLWGSLQ